ncbi:hypothetical protein D3C71_1273330 [compost metagenome]
MRAAADGQVGHHAHAHAGIAARVLHALQAFGRQPLAEHVRVHIVGVFGRVALRGG